MTYINMFDVALIAAAKKCGQEEVDYYMSLPIVKHEFSKRHTGKIKNLFRREKYADTLSAIQTFSKRAVAAILIVCTVLFGTVISIKAVREDIWETLPTFFEEYFSFGTDNHEVQLSITEYKSPTWLPKGFTETDTTKTEQHYDIFYLTESGGLLAYAQYMYDYSATLYDNEDVVITDVTINNLNGKLLQYGEGKDESILIWYDEKYCYSLVAPLPKDILIRVAENVK